MTDKCDKCNNREIPSDMVQLYPMTEEHIAHLAHLREIACSVCPKNAEEWVLQATAVGMMVAGTKAGYEQGCVDTGKRLIAHLKELEYLV